MIHRIKTYSIWLVCLFLSASSLVIGCSKDNIVIDFASNEDEFIERYSVSRATKHIDCSDGLKILSINFCLRYSRDPVLSESFEAGTGRASSTLCMALLMAAERV